MVVGSFQSCASNADTKRLVIFEYTLLGGPCQSPVVHKSEPLIFLGGQSVMAF